MNGFAKFFIKHSDVKHGHGVTLMEYQAGGGKVVLLDIAKPNRLDWGTAMDAITAALELEKTVGIYNFST